MEQEPQKVVLGLGNILNQDEGLGVEAVLLLEKRFPAGAGWEFIDGGVMGLDLLPIVEQATHLLILDSVLAGGSPGDLIRLEKEEIPLYQGVKLSLHQTTFQEVLGLAQFRGHMPEHLVLLGIHPAELELGVGISPLVKECMSVLLDQAEAQLHIWDQG